MTANVIVKRIVTVNQPRKLQITMNRGARGAVGPQGPPGTAGPISSTSAEALTAGDLISLDSAGKVQKADASIAGGKFRAFAVADQTVGAADLAVDIITSGRHAVRFASAPAAASNGSPVFLSMTGGLATLTSPDYPADTGNVSMQIGVLEGADGVSTTPDVMLNFHPWVRL